MSAFSNTLFCSYINDVKDVPELKPHFFYSSPITIDDTSFVLPPPGKYPLLPFSKEDNESLEKAWKKYFSELTLKSESDYTGEGPKPAPSQSHDAPTSTEQKIKGECFPTSKLSCGKNIEEELGDGEEWGITTQDIAEAMGDSPTPSSYMSCEEENDPCSTSGTAELQRMLQVASESNSSWQEVNLEAPSAAHTDSPNSPRSDVETVDQLNHQGHNHNEHSFPGITIDVVVGTSRLYAVQLPSLQILPVYWSPIHDGPFVTRGTWYYKDSMYPVEPAIANQLELGYIATRPWRQEWIEKLRREINDGVNGDQSFFYKLRLEGEDDAKRVISSSSDESPVSKSHNHNGSCLGSSCSTDNKNPVLGAINDSKNKSADQVAVIKSYLGSLVCYEDEKNAFILRPGIEQFKYNRLRSLSKMVGGSVGISVLRGFDRERWERLHPSQNPASLNDPPDLLSPTTTVDTNTADADVDAEPPEILDLVFVVHGIGQKLSQRYQDFSFTHAVNSLRRLVNADSRNPVVRKGLRENFGGIMFLPINWRSNISFGDGTAGPVFDGQDSDLKQPSHPKRFGLNDITPQSIPAVRSLISDVLLDIPLYMSSHKTQMMEAVVKEANRIYRLWCQNNPGFQKRGRVHIIGHSLGSALCLDILSQQPTFVKPFSSNDQISTKNLEFNTTNLFFAGSPVGFFLLLGGGKLLPRAERTKPGLGLDEENSRHVTGKEGTYGCMAVDNIYNILHYDDPIAYRLNATIDVDYAASIKKAEVPSALGNGSWMVSFSYAAQSFTQNMPSFSTSGFSTPSPSTVNLPNLSMSSMSSIVKEVADTSSSPFLKEVTKGKKVFTDVEKKVYLLNDNGQCDWFLKANEGPDIQYLNMLWAHGSYWSNADFVRLLVTEIGRMAGGENAVEAMKAIRIENKGADGIE